MKIYYDGSSWTYGSELLEPEKTRWTKIVSDHYNAEEYNIGLKGSCNRRMVRNLIEHDLNEFDIVIIQMTMSFRTEYYDGEEWVQVAPSKIIERDNYAKYYYSKIYHDEYAKTDDKIFYGMIKNLLKDKKHLIVSCDRGKSQSKVELDMDLSLMLDNPAMRKDVLQELGKKPPYPRDPKHYRHKGGHPNVLGNQIIAKYIINALESEDYRKNAIASHDEGWWSSLDHVQDIKNYLQNWIS